MPRKNTLSRLEFSLLYLIGSKYPRPSADDVSIKTICGHDDLPICIWLYMEGSSRQRLEAGPKGEAENHPLEGRNCVCSWRFKRHDGCLGPRAKGNTSALSSCCPTV